MGQTSAAPGRALVSVSTVWTEKSHCSVFITEICPGADEVQTSFNRHGKQDFNLLRVNIYSVVVSPAKCRL